MCAGGDCGGSIHDGHGAQFRGGPAGRVRATAGQHQPPGRPLPHQPHHLRQPQVPPTSPWLTSSLEDSPTRSSALLLSTTLDVQAAVIHVMIRYRHAGALGGNALGYEDRLCNVLTSLIALDLPIMTLHWRA